MRDEEKVLTPEELEALEQKKLKKKERQRAWYMKNKEKILEKKRKAPRKKPEPVRPLTREEIRADLKRIFDAEKQRQAADFL